MRFWPFGRPAGRKTGSLPSASPASFGSIGRPWEYDGRIITPDPGLPLLEAAAGSADTIWAGQPSVRKVVDFIARNVSSIPWHTFRRVSDTDRERVTDHPLAQLLNRPGVRTTSQRLWHSLLVDYLLYDRWCAEIVRSADTESGWELLRIPAPRMRLRTDLNGRVDAVIVYGLDGKSRTASPDGFVFDHGYATEGANGTSPIRTLSNLLAESDEAVAFRRGIWRNGARVPAVIERPADTPWSEDAKARFKESWRAFIAGGGNEGGTPILEDGMKLSKVDAFTPRDTNDLEGRKLTDAEVAAAYHIAPELVGAKDSTYSNVDAFRQMLYRDNLGPLISAVEQALNLMLVPAIARRGEQLYVEANVDVKLRGSFEEEAAVLQASTGAPWLTRNEARARRNLPALEGGDELVTPLNVTTGGLASPQDTARPGDQDPEQDTPARASATRLDIKDETASPGLAPAATEQAALERDLATMLSRTAAVLSRADNPVGMLGHDSYDETVASLLAGRGRRIAETGAERVLAQYDPTRAGWKASVLDNWVTKAAVSHAAGIQTSLRKTIAAGGGGDQLARLDEWTARAGVWAATMATEFASFGAHDAAGACGLDTKTWRAGDRRHAYLDGHTLPIGGLFPGDLRWPADPTAAQDERVNCRCRCDYSKG